MLSPGLHNIDAMQALKEYPDNYFELAIADPPYGEGLASEGGCKTVYTANIHGCAADAMNIIELCMIIVRRAE